MDTPQNQLTRPPWQHYLRRVLAVDAIIFGVVGIVCLLAEHLRSWAGYGSGLILAGAVIVGFAVFSVLGGLNASRTQRSQMAGSAGPGSLYERGQGQASTVNGAMRALLEALALALPPLIIGALLRILFNSPAA